MAEESAPNSDYAVRRNPHPVCVSCKNRKGHLSGNPSGAGWLNKRAKGAGDKCLRYPREFSRAMLANSQSRFERSYCRKTRMLTVRSYWQILPCSRKFCDCVKRSRKVMFEKKRKNGILFSYYLNRTQIPFYSYLAFAFF